jgi:hypothetical protein
MCLSGFNLSGLVDPMHFFTSNPNTAAATAPAVAAPVAPPQAATMPSATPQTASNVPGGGINSGPASTMLTGNSGVATSSLNLGKGTTLGSNTLLGS